MHDLEPLTKGDRLRIVTVLFADVSGFTELSENLHPEEIKDIMDECFSGLTEEITSRGGTIDKYIGDCVMALFGAETAHEDDPERAIDAALAMQHFLSGFSESLNLKTGLELAMRVGINTGTVLAGYVGSGDSQDFTVMGDAVNLASRLEHACPVGSILTSHDTYRMVQGLFEVRRLDPIRVKGKAERVRVVEILSRRPGGVILETPTFNGVATRMIGREREIKQLRSAFLATREKGRALPVTLRSDIGMGKSRLLYEFVTWLTGREEFDLDLLRCRDYRTESTYAPLVDLVHRLVDVDVDDEPELLTEKTGCLLDELNATGDERNRIEAALLNLLGIPARSVPLLAGLAGDPEQLESAVREGILALYRIRASRRPVLVAVEDLHTASDPFLDLVAMLSSLEDLPLLVVMTFRPEADQRVEERFGLHENRIHCSLEALTRIESDEMIRDLLQRADEIPDDLIKRITDVSEGRPLFIEEILADLAERDIIRSDIDPWEINVSGLRDVALPQSVEAAILSRVDALPEAAAETLQIAAVTGDACWELLIRDFGVPGYRAIIDELGERQFIRFRRQPQIPGTREFTFCLPAVREALEHHVLRKLKVHWHDAIAEWLEAWVSGEHEYFDRLLGHHHFEAGNVREALPYRLRSGRRAEERGDVKRALEDLQWVWKHCRSEGGEFLLDAVEVAESRVAVARLLRRMGKPDEAETAYSETQDTFSELRKENIEIDLSMRRVNIETARLFIQTGEYEKASFMLDNAIEDLKTDNDERLLLVTSAIKRKAWLHFLNNDYEEAMSLYDKGIELVENLGFSRELGGLLDGKGVCLSKMKRFEEAEKTLNLALEHYDSVGFREGSAGVQGNLGVLRYRQEMHDEALNHFQKACNLNDSIGHIVVGAICRANMGDVLMELGDLAGAHDKLKVALTVLRRTKSIEHWIEAQTSLIRCLSASGHRTEERREVEELHKVTEQSGKRKHILRSLSHLCRLGAEDRNAVGVSSFLDNWKEVSTGAEDEIRELNRIARRQILPIMEELPAKHRHLFEEKDQKRTD